MSIPINYEGIKNMTTQAYTTGVIPAGGVATINCGGWTAPFTATLTSTAGNRAIAFNTAPGTTPEPAIPDVDAAGFINFAFLAPVKDIQFTGAQGDVWEIR